MLNAKLLIAETAKFFALNPGRWIKGALSSANDSRLGTPEAERDCKFCAVGYMAHRLILDQPERAARIRANPYEEVSKFLGVPSGSIHRPNDRSSSPQEVVNFLKGQANAAR